MLQNYLKIAIRNLLKYKLYSTINILGLAVGIAGCMLILLWVQDELAYDQFNEKSERIFRVVKMPIESDEQGVARVGAPWGPALQQDFPEVEAFVRFRFFGRALFQYGEQRAYETEGLYADSAIFDIFSFSMLSGNPKTALTQPNAMVLTESLAKKYFGDENPLGKTIRVDGGREFLVSGVMADVPQNAHFHFDFLVSFVTHKAWYVREWRMNNYHLYLLLTEAESAVNLEHKIPDFLLQHIGETGMAEARYTVALQPIESIHLHSNLFREMEANGDITHIYIFSIIAIFILAIACINFMNLATARATRRAREVGMRKVVGANRFQLIRQFLGESFLLNLLAMLIAIVVVEICLPWFNQFTGKSLEMAYTENWLLSIGSLTILILLSLFSGIYPAFFLSAFRPIAVLKGSEAASGKNAAFLRKALVVAQFTITVALVIGTITVYRQLDFMQNKKLGFGDAQIMVGRMEDAEVEKQYAALRSELLAIPGIEEVARSSALPGRGDWGMPLRYWEKGEPQRFSTRVMVVDNDYVPTLQMEVMKGRAFSPEMGTDSSAFIINETAATALGWGMDAIGKELARPIRKDEATGEWIYQTGKVIGIVKDFHFRSMRETIKPLVMYVDSRSYYYVSMRLHPQNIAQTIPAVQNIWQTFDPARPFEYFFVDSIFESMYRSERQLSDLFTIFSALALAVACLGLFGLAAFTAEQRFKEIGIRKILGASPAQIVALLTKDAGKWVLIANLIAWPIAYFAIQSWLANFAYRIAPDASIFLFAGGLALTVAFLTICYQALKAAFTRPADALRYE